jgi:phosphatidylglycerophosphate synthase
MGSLERPALRWLAAHSPAWITPDFYTVVGLAGSLVTLLGYVLSRTNTGFFWLASLGLVFNWYGDSLDGTLARYRHIERPVYGYFVDHALDLISQVLILIGLGLSPYISFDLTCFALIAFLAMSALVFLRTYVVGEFKISYAKLGPTEARLLAILFNTAMFIFGPRSWAIQVGTLGKIAINPYNLVVGVVAFLLGYFFILTAFQESIRLARENR